MRKYFHCGLREVARIEKWLSRLPPGDASLLIESPQSRVQRIKDALAANQSFLDVIIETATELLEDSVSHSDRPVLERNVSKVRSTLRQFVRDWSAEGARERQAAYDPLLADLERFVAVGPFKRDHGKAPRILCPGSGLGRLPFEVARRGYCAQGNEFSYCMLFGSNYILNHHHKAESVELYPYCLSTSNRVRHDDNLTKILIPDIAATATEMPVGAELSMVAGEFVEVYAAHVEEWDAVATCFFLDTAKNVVEYIKTIAAILKPGGLWTNVGPLLYHYAEDDSEPSIELSWEELARIIRNFFEFKSVGWRECGYTSNARCMMQTFYHCVHFAAIRNTKSAEPLKVSKCTDANE